MNRLCLCKYYTILYRGPTCSQIWVSIQDLGTNPYRYQETTVIFLYCVFPQLLVLVTQRVKYTRPKYAHTSIPSQVMCQENIHFFKPNGWHKTALRTNSAHHLLFVKFCQNTALHLHIILGEKLKRSEGEELKSCKRDYTASKQKIFTNQSFTESFCQSVLGAPFIPGAIL